MSIVWHRVRAKAARSGFHSPIYDAPTGTGKTTAQTDRYYGRFVKVVPNEQVVEAVEFETTNPALQGEMTITIALSDADGGTEICAVHDGLPPGLSPAANEAVGGRRWRSSRGWSRGRRVGPAEFDARAGAAVAQRPPVRPARCVAARVSSGLPARSRRRRVGLLRPYQPEHRRAPQQGKGERAEIYLPLRLHDYLHSSGARGIMSSLRAPTVIAHSETDDRCGAVTAVTRWMNLGARRQQWRSVLREEPVRAARRRNLRRAAAISPHKPRRAADALRRNAFFAGENAPARVARAEAMSSI